MIADGRPVLCSEYMNRPVSTFQMNLPMMCDNGVCAINWELVSGKTQTIYPWKWDSGKGEPEYFFHDVFHRNGRLLYPEEKEVFDRVSGS